jgi:hypothetical protein
VKKASMALTTVIFFVRKFAFYGRSQINSRTMVQRRNEVFIPHGWPETNGPQLSP